MNFAFLVHWLADVPGQAAPYALATLGLILAERAGVLSLTAEGLMLVGALSGIATSVALGGHPLLACVMAMAATCAVSVVFAFFATVLRANQIISGLAVVFLCQGLTTLLGSLGGLTNQTVAGLGKWPIPGLSDLPVVGPVLFDQDAIVYLVPVIFLAVHHGLRHTMVGLRLRATGEDPATADATGVSVWRYRFIAVVVGSALIGLAGAYLSLVNTKVWMPGMTGGRGWIAVALVIFSQWRPGRALAGAILFGSIEALLPHLAAAGVKAPQYLMLMAPYLATLAAMVLAAGSRATRAPPPAALGQPYVREERA
jgi:general nucleoside transport system permease protein